MNDLKNRKSVCFSFEPARVQFCAAAGIEIDVWQGENRLRPDASTAFVEFTLAHAFPVVTNYRTAIHPKVLQNSFRTMRWKVFNLAHLMRAYDPQNNPRDRILGAILGVEYTGGTEIAASREASPGIRAAAAMFKNAEQVNEILQSYARGSTPWGDEWTVSMENLSWLENSGFLVKGKDGVEEFADATPSNLSALDYVYVPCVAAPLELLRCLNDESDDEADGISSRRVKRQFRGQETVLLLGGLDGNVFFNGVGLTPGGQQEAEANVAQMLAGGGLMEVNGVLLPDFFAPLRKLTAVAKKLSES